MISISFRCAMCLLVLVCAASKHAVAQATLPDYGYQWSTITHAGNRFPNAQEAPRWFDPILPAPVYRGQVNYEYRIAQTNVTNAEFARFLEAYKPHMDFFERTSSTVTSRFISYNRTSQQFVLDLPIFARTAAEDVPWLMAARYVNWLHNDQALTQDAFNFGAYDLRSITNYVGHWEGIIPHRLPGAKFWIPSMDELIKATYYDPNRYGPGQEGYWKYMQGSDSPPIYTYPELGGQSDASVPTGTYNLFRRDDVDAYPTGRTPWGLFGMSGGVGEYSDSFNGRWSPTNYPYIEYIRSMTSMGFGFESNDKLEQSFGSTSPLGFGSGFRIASLVPSPPTMFVGVFLAAFIWRKR